MSRPRASESPLPSGFRLPSGRHGIPAEEVAENQRLRLLAAAADALLERGYVDTTSVLIAKLAGVSSATFYEHFDNVAGCLLAAYGSAADCVVEVVTEGCAGEEDRARRLRAGIDSALAFLQAEPALANLLGAEAAAGDAGIAAARDRLIARLAELLGAGPHLLESAYALVADRLGAGVALPELGPELFSILSAPALD